MFSNSFSSPGGFPPQQQPQQQQQGFMGTTSAFGMPTQNQPGGWGATASTSTTSFPMPSSSAFGTMATPSPMQPATGGFNSFGTNTSTGFTMPTSTPGTTLGGMGSPLGTGTTSAWGASTPMSNPLGGGTSSLWPSSSTQPTNPLMGGSTTPGGWNAPGSNPLGGGNVWGTSTTNPMSNAFAPTSNPTLGSTSGWSSTPGTGTTVMGSTWGNTGPASMGTMMGGFTSVGSGNPPWSKTNEADSGSSNTLVSLMSISAMGQYRNKSVEEIRYEDYRKQQGGPQGALTNPLGTGLMGNAPTSTAPWSSTNTASNPLGAGGTSLFGTPQSQTQPSGSGLFMPSASQPSGFIPPPAASSTNPLGGFFGSSNQTPLGGPTPSTNLFGTSSTSTTGSLFGTPSTTTNPLGGGTSSIFGTPSTQTNPLGAGGSLFGNQSTMTNPLGGGGGLLGSANPLGGGGTSLFGGSTTNPLGGGGGLLGSTNPLGGGGTSLFGTTQPTSGFPIPALGSTGTQQTSLFGSTNPLGSTATTGLTGTTNPLGGGLFGTSSATAGTTSSLFPSLSSSTPTTNLFGTSNSLGGLGTSSFSTFPTAATNLQQLQQQQQLLQLQQLQQRPPIATIDNPLVPNYSSRISVDNLPTVVSTPSPTPSPQRTPSIPTQLIRPIRSTPRSLGGAKSRTEAIKEEEAVISMFKPRSPLKKLDISVEAQLVAKSDSDTDGFPQLDKANGIDHAPQTNASIADQQQQAQTTPLRSRSDQSSQQQQQQQQQQRPQSPNVLQQQQTIESLLPRIGKDWYILPSLQEMSKMSVEQLKSIENLKLGVPRQAEITFEGKTDVRNLNLNELIRFGWGEITVYPDDWKKPPVGEGLNKPAMISLHFVFPKDKEGKRVDTPENLKKYEEMLRDVTKQQGATFLEYTDAGTWKFRVEHFTRYGLPYDKMSYIIDDQNAEPNQQKQIDLEPSKQSQQSQQIPSSEQLTTTEILSDQNDEDSIPIESISDSLIVPENEVNHVGQETVEKIQTRLTTEREKYYNETLGLDSPKLQQMKSVFFPGSDHYSLSNLRQDETTTKQNQLLPNEQAETIKPPQPIPQLVSVIPRQLKRTAEDASLFSEIRQLTKQFRINSSKKAAFSLARSFRVGWGPKGLFVHSGTSILKQKKQIGTATFDVTLQRLDSAVGLCSKTHPPSNEIENLLQIHKEISANTAIQNKTHLEKNHNAFYFSQPLDGDEYLKQTILYLSNQNERQSELFWTLKLVEALWANRFSAANVFKGDLLINDNEQQEENWEQLARRFAVGVWLKEKLENFQEKTEKQNVGVYSTLFDLLSRKQISQAVDLAIKNRDLHLATLLPQSVSSVESRNFIKQQLLHWKKQKIDNAKFIDPALLKVYRLLSGEMVAENLDWERCFGLLNWFVSDPNLFVKDLMSLYSFINPLPQYLRQTNPPFLEKPNSIVVENDEILIVTGTEQQSKFFKMKDSVWQQISNEEKNKLIKDFSRAFDSVVPFVKDSNFQLLSLYTDKNQLSNVMNALENGSSSPFPLDYRHFWHVFTSLYSFNLIQHDWNSLVHLYVGYATQLEIEGLWKWAIYVLLKIPVSNDGSLPLAIVSLCKTILARNISNSASEEERKFLSTIGVHKRWIEESLSWKSSEKADFLSQLNHLCNACECGQCQTEDRHLPSNNESSALWFEANQLFIKFVAPTLILEDSNEKFAYFLETFHRHQQFIENWSSTTQLFYDYYRISQIRLEDSVVQLNDLEKSLRNTLSIVSNYQQIRNFLSTDSSAKPYFMVKEIQKELAAISKISKFLSKTLLRIVEKTVVGSQERTIQVTKLMDSFSSVPFSSYHLSPEQRIELLPFFARSILDVENFA